MAEAPKKNRKIIEIRSAWLHGDAVDEKVYERFLGLVEKRKHQ